MMARFTERIGALLKNHVFTFFVAPVVVAVASAVIALAAIDKLVFLTSADRFIADWEIAFIAPAAPQDPDIVVVAINEDTLAQFPYRSPVDRAFVSGLLKYLASTGPRAIGVDLLFDQPTEPPKDEALKKTLNEIQVPLAVVYVRTENVVNEKQTAFLDEFVPLRIRALANIGTDQLDTVRTVYPGDAGKDGVFVPSLSVKLAEAAGVNVPRVEIPIAWHGQPSPGEPAFTEYPAQVAEKLPAAFFKDKIVLIGTDISLVDRHRTPYSTVANSGEAMMAGVVIQANMLSQLLHGTSAPYVPGWMNLLIALGAGALGGWLGGTSLSMQLRVGAGAACVLLLWSLGGALYHYAGVMIGLIAPTLSFALAFWAMEALSGREARQQREFIQGAFSRYVSPKVVDQLIRDPTKLSLEGERRLMTYLFTDIANFTTMSEGVEAKELARVLNAYLYGLTGIVLKHGGMVDKFIGDSVFAIFNAPVEQPGHAEHAVQCALEMDNFAEHYHKEQNKKGVPFGLTRIGVHTGTAVIGNFGSNERLEYTAQGDAVNTASRLEGLNKTLGTRICVSDATRALCPNIHFRPIASVILKGKTAAVDVWEPLRDGAERPDFLARYGEAFAKLQAGAPEALELFSALNAENENDPCVSLHVKRLRSGDHGAVLMMTEK